MMKVFLNGELVGVVLNTTMMMKTSVSLEVLQDAVVELAISGTKVPHRVAGWGPTYETADARIVERLRLKAEVSCG